MTMVMVLIVAWCVGVMVEGTRANVDGAVGGARATWRRWNAPTRRSCTLF